MTSELEQDSFNSVKLESYWVNKKRKICIGLVKQRGRQCAVGHIACFVDKNSKTNYLGVCTFGSTGFVESI